MATKQVSIPEIGTVVLYKRRGNRSLRLSISNSGQVRVSLPHWVPYSAGEQFARSKQAWILQNRTTSDTPLRPGHAIGKAHRLRFESQLGTERVSTRVAANEVRISYPSLYSLDHPSVQRAAIKASTLALKREASVLLPQRLRALSLQTGLSYKSVTIKQLKSRWGSCNTNKEITLNLYLMQLPWSLIDYVLIHELVHTKVMQHGKPFWDEMERHLPGARRLRKQVGSYQPRLSPIERGMA